MEYKTGTIKPILKGLFIDFMNNYATVSKFAEHNRIALTEAKALINAGRKYHNAEAKTYKRISKRAVIV